ncbi:MAG: hypothetical protein IIY77_04175, partial [Lachnospiraceae bacterium]|nr:hypothetical protein [Lachnospiraceae bacterium]
MKNRVNQIRQGTIEYPVPAVRLIQDRIGQMVLPGKTVAAEVSVVSDNGIPMHLFFVSDSPRVTVPEQLTFGRSGKFTVEISTKGLLLGEVLKGTIHILYNGGILELPYEYPVVMAKNAEKEYAFVDFDSFVNFYRTSRIEAAAVFSWDEFLDFPFMADMRLRALYHTFFHARSRDHGLSEFLKAAGVRNYEGEKAPDPYLEKREQLKEKALAEEASENVMMLRLAALVLEALLYQHKHPEGPFMDDPGFSALIKDYPSEVLPVMAASWFLLKKNEIRQARDLLVGIQDPVQKARHEKKDLYCVFLYLVSQVQRNEERLQESIKLSRKYYQEGEFTRLLNFLVYHIDPEYEDLSRAATYLSTSAGRHGADALMLQDLCFLFEKSTDGFDSLNPFVLQAMLYGLRKGILSEKTLFNLLSLPLKSMNYLPLYMEVLKTGYRVCHNKELLQAVADVLLQKKETGDGFLYWYHEALYSDIRLPGLFEAYLKSQKKDPGVPLPRDLVLYFNEHRDVKGITFDVLYANVLAFYKQDEEVYPAYRDRILSYTLERLAAGDYDREKMRLYEEILDDKFVDKSTADDLLQLLYVKRIRTSLPNMKRGVVSYGQIDRDYRTNLEEDTAYLPVYSDEAVIAFEDDHGIRYCDPDAEAEYVFDHEEGSERP